jgi:DNA photolyase
MWQKMLIKQAQCIKLRQTLDFFLNFCMRTGRAVAAAVLLHAQFSNGLIVRQAVVPGSLHLRTKHSTTSARTRLRIATTNICVWLRNDLRVDDNYALAFAAHEASKAKKRGDTVAVLPIYCFDPELYEGSTPWGSRKTGAYRARFLLESVADLRESLRKLGSDLCINTTSPADAIAHLLGPVCEGETRIVVCHKEVTSEEAAADSLVEERLKDLGHDAGLKKLWGSTLYHPAGMRLIDIT